MFESVIIRLLIGYIGFVGFIPWVYEIWQTKNILYLILLEINGASLGF